ncbi:very long chain fatty acid elongase 7-like [Periplaneta americana]|uniref:very long chain fatty acid elongase 7-like n=1 Tax=Periplaneta americana TaxID=6978 RepID=UPI0037E837B4
MKELTTVYSTYLQVVYDLADRRTRDWFLTGSPWTFLLLLGSYLYFVNSGPRFMKNRPVYNIDGIIGIYDIAQVIICSYLFIKGITFGWGTKLRLFCEPVDTSNSPLANEMALWVWMLYMTKMLDLLDTVFIVLRKKNNQLSFLHVFHHATMLFLLYYTTRWSPGGHCVLNGTINCFVHVVMYAYYFITNAFPEYKKNIWWKKHITEIQLVQFVLIIIHTLPTLIQEDCGYPAFGGGLIFLETSIILYLFSKFYVKIYWKKKEN